MLSSLIISDCYFALLVKSEEILKLKDLVDFLEPWYSINKHANKIFQYLDINRFHLDANAKLLLLPPSEAKWKTVFQTI